MGTSSAFGGGKRGNPLLPTWLGDGNTDSSGNSSEDDKSQNPERIDGDTATDNSPEHNLASTDRYREARRQFTIFIKSGGTERKRLGKSVSSYVNKTAGGSRNASKRLASERAAGVAFGSFLLDANARGLQEAIRDRDIRDLADRPTIEIYTLLVDFICTPGGDLDDSFARDAYLETIVEVVELGITDLEKPSLDTISIIMERFIANAIFTRILNSIANKLVILPDNTQTIKQIQTQLKEFIGGAVEDTIKRIGKSFTLKTIKPYIDSLFQQSFAILQSMAEMEGNK